MDRPTNYFPNFFRPRPTLPVYNGDEHPVNGPIVTLTNVSPPRTIDDAIAVELFDNFGFSEGSHCVPIERCIE